MALKIITAPTAEPVTLAEAKAHLRVTHDDEDALIGTLIVAARQALDGKDGILGRALVTQSWVMTLDAFPSGRITIPLPPLQQIDGVEYKDPAGVWQVVPDTDYQLDIDSEPGVLAPVTVWPETADVMGAVRILFTAGYGDAEDVPAGLKAAMLLHIGDLFANRERSSDRQAYESPAYDALVFPFRTRLIG